MKLKRVYDFEAPEEKWTTREDPCPTCGAKGVVISETLDGVEDCPDCDGGIQTRLIPPVAGVEVLKVNPFQHFSPRLTEGGREEGWLVMKGSELIISGTNKKLTYQINRVPGKYNGEQINYYDCELVKEESA